MNCYGPWRIFQYWFFPADLPMDCLVPLNSDVGAMDLGVGRYLLLFGLTFLIELPIYRLALKGLPTKKILLVTLLLNLATHPIVTFLFPWGAQDRFTMGGYVASAEVFAPAVEAALLVFLYRVSPTRAVPGAVLANLSSWGLGLWLLSL